MGTIRERTPGLPQAINTGIQNKQEYFLIPSMDDYRDFLPGLITSSWLPAENRAQSDLHTTNRPPFIKVPPSLPHRSQGW